MWFRGFLGTIKRDQPNVKYQVEPGRGISGCEMHEINGWGNSLQWPQKKKKRGLHRRISATRKKRLRHEPAGRAHLGPNSGLSSLPALRAIIETMKSFIINWESRIKQVQCERCGNKFVAKKPHKPKFGPLIGEEQPPEWDWK